MENISYKLLTVAEDVGTSFVVGALSSFPKNIYDTRKRPLKIAVKRSLNTGLNHAKYTLLYHGIKSIINTNNTITSFLASVCQKSNYGIVFAVKRGLIGTAYSFGLSKLNRLINNII